MSREPVYLEIGDRRTLAASLRWPGWARFGRDRDAALDALAAYAPRYAQVAERAGATFAPDASNGFEVVHERAGGGATDFGALDKPPPQDFQGCSPEEGQRLAALLEAAWAVLDEVAASAPEELTKGPRGGGRDTSGVVAHVEESERSYARSIGVRWTPTEFAQEGGRDRMRAEVAARIRGGQTAEEAEGAGGWPIAYAARRFTWHALDHAWEIEDKSP